MHQIVCRLGLRSRSPWGADSAPQTLDFKGPTSKGEGKGQEAEGKGEEGREGEINGGKKRGGEGKGGKMGRGEIGEGRGRVTPKLKLVPQNYFSGAGAALAKILGGPPLFEQAVWKASYTAARSQITGTPPSSFFGASAVTHSDFPKFSQTFSQSISVKSASAQ